MKRLDPKTRRKEILDAALKLAEKRGFDRLTQGTIARAAGISVSLIPYYFKSMNGMRKAVMKEAINCESLGVIAHGVAVNHPLTRQMDPLLRHRALAHIA